MSSKQTVLFSAVLISIGGVFWYVIKTDKTKESKLNPERSRSIAGATLPAENRVTPLPQLKSDSGSFVGGTTWPEIRSRVRMRIESLVGNPATPNLDPEQFKKAFEAFIHPNLVIALEGMSVEQESGKTIAGDCDPFGSEALTISIALQEKGELPFASGPTEQEALLGMFSILMIQAGAGGREIPNTLEGLSSRLPPTRADFIVCMAVREALQAVNRTSGPLRSEEFAAWQRLATAQNPVYRGLALIGAPRVCIDQAQLTTIYASFGHESDSELFRRAIERLSQFANSDAQSALRAIREDVLKTGRSKLLSILDNALLQQAEAVNLRAAYGDK